MIIEGIGSFIFMIIVAYLIWHLHTSGKRIKQHQRDVEENRAKTLSSKSARFEE